MAQNRLQWKTIHSTCMQHDMPQSVIVFVVFCTLEASFLARLAHPELFKYCFNILNLVYAVV